MRTTVTSDMVVPGCGINWPTPVKKKFHVGLGDRGFDPGVPEQDDDALVRGAPHRGRITAPDAGRVFEEGIADGLSVAQQQAAFRGREVQYPA